MSAPDPNLPQRIASDPGASVWVSANAGSGKTKVLTDRVLRLLLNDTAPSRILCITYTKTAATEMQTRIFGKLSGWAVMEDDQLKAALADLTGNPSRDGDLARARRLFTRLLEESPPLRVQTIHSFCQSVLARFPLEAGVPPHFTVLDERSAAELLAQAKFQLLTDSQGQDAETLAALAYFIDDLSEGRFGETLKALVQERRKMMHMLGCDGGRRRIHRGIHEMLETQPGISEEELLQRHLDHSDAERSQLLSIAETIRAEYPESKNVILGANAISRYHAGPATPARMREYVEAMSTSSQTNDEGIYTAGYFYSAPVKKQFPQFVAPLDRERQRLVAYVEARRRHEAAENSAHHAVLAHVLFGLYEQLKRQRGVLDYDDLILHASKLLCGSRLLPWVLYKLDGGIDHLLLDEAQDTAPEQWQIANALVSEFFSGLSARLGTRTLFVVGDHKQSIFRFQGADPAQFASWESEFARRAGEAGERFARVALDISFRSAQAVLDVVDRSFAQLAEAGQFTPAAPHTAFRTGEAGRVECWPLIPRPKNARSSLWEIAEAGGRALSPERQLAAQIAHTIRGWFDDKRCLAASGKPVSAGDIMILVRSRARIDRAIGQALREAGIPVAGLDRIALTDDLAVKDLLALGRFVLLPEDDLTLAILLKSPLLGIDEEQLFRLCHGRRASLWEALRVYDGDDRALRSAAQKLQHWAQLSRRHASPFAFFSELLHAEDGMRRLVSRLGSSARESVHSFLEQARIYESSHAAGLQGFLHWLERGSGIIKRDMEHGEDAVRILTVHSAKGLEAPIVFLPQMVRAERRGTVRLLPHHHDGLDLMLPQIKKEDAPALFNALRTRVGQEDEAEQMRLLYVAMTRAKDELYLCGVAPAQGQPADWYDAARAGFEGLPGVEAVEEEFGTRLIYANGVSDGKARKAAHESAASIPLPAHFSRALPDEAASPLLTPSNLTQDDIPRPSPAAPSIGGLRPNERGVLIHKLFEILGGLDPAARARIAPLLLASHAPKELPEEARAEIVSLVLAILSDGAFAQVFSPASLAEVALSGKLEDGVPARGIPGPFVLSSQVDRLRVEKEDVWVIDYKTGKYPEDGAIPAIYLNQMEAYRALLTRIYPGRTVHCALLFTTVPVLLPV